MALSVYSPPPGEVNVNTTSERNSFEMPAKRRRLNDLNDYVIKSEIKEEQFSFEWKLKDFSTLSSRFPEIRSPILVGGPISKHNWQMKIVPRRVIGEKVYASVHLILIGFGDDKDEEKDEEDSPARKIRARFQLRILNAEGIPLVGVGDYQMRDLEFRKFTHWGWSEFFLSKEADSFTVDDALTLSCRIWLEGEVQHELTDNSDIHRAVSLPKKLEAGALLLANHLGTLVNDPETSDVTILIKLDSKKLMAHRCILTARSPVFARMFSTNMRESRENSITIKDFESEIVMGMLEWIYTGQTRLLPRRAADLIQIAEKYDLDGLKKDCENILVEKLSVNNAVKLLVLGHMHNAPYLKRRALDLTISKKEQVVKTAAYKEMAENFNYTGVFVELFIHIATMKK
ncbi:unnamed protein product [Orchesella dallaii]|uniref:Speckle-type POZ protein n=1 Tax=Orchesella dallaii TaxID=48710 RepID=A0ABP1RU20_9HEXA